MRQEGYNIADVDFEDVMKELISIGLGKAARVISELADSYVKLGVVNIYRASDLRQLSMFSSYIIVQEMSGDVINGKTIFSMGDHELLKLLKYLEVVEESEHLGDIHNYSPHDLEMILDTYQEIGNIILGNVISNIVDCVKSRVEINLPFLSDKSVLEEITDGDYIVIDVLFNIDKLDANGKLFLINDSSTYQKLIENLKKCG